MRRFAGLLWLMISVNALGATPPSILNNSAHIVGDATAALTVFGVSYTTTAGPTSSLLAVNQTCSGNCTAFLDPAVIIGNATNVAQTEYAATSTSTVTPSVPYQIINQSSSGYTLAGYEQANYAAILSGGLVYSMAYCGQPMSGDYPPTAFVTMLPNNASSNDIGASGCGYANGIEFSIPVNSSSCSSTCSWTPIAGGGSIDVSSPSATTEAMSATLAALKSHHPLWNWQDIKSVLRSTGSNWATGYVAYNATGPAFGYGNINYSSANSYSGTIYLQPPGLQSVEGGSHVKLTLYPFNTTRRSGELIYAFNLVPTFPSPSSNNEYTYSQISALVGTYGGTHVYTSNGSSGIQHLDYSPPSANKPLYFVAFTVDNISSITTAHFSRAEKYSLKPVYFRAPAVGIIDKLLILR